MVHGQAEQGSSDIGQWWQKPKMRADVSAAWRCLGDTTGPYVTEVGSLWKLSISRGQEAGRCWPVMRRNHGREILDVQYRSPVLFFQTYNTHSLPQWLDGNSTFQLLRAKSSSLGSLGLLCFFHIPYPTHQIILLTLSRLQPEPDHLMMASL